MYLITATSCAPLASNTFLRLCNSIEPTVQLLYSLFNAIDDDTYLEDESELEHCLLSDEGIIWRGTKDTPLGRRWLYGQVSLVRRVRWAHRKWALLSHISTRTSPWMWPCWCCEMSLRTNAELPLALLGVLRPESVLTTTAVRTEPSQSLLFHCSQRLFFFVVQDCSLCLTVGSMAEESILVGGMAPQQSFRSTFGPGRPSSELESFVPVFCGD